LIGGYLHGEPAPGLNSTEISFIGTKPRYSCDVPTFEGYLLADLRAALPLDIDRFGAQAIFELSIHEGSRLSDYCEKHQ